MDADNCLPNRNNAPSHRLYLLMIMRISNGFNRKAKVPMIAAEQLNEASLPEIYGMFW